MEIRTKYTQDDPLSGLGPGPIRIMGIDCGFGAPGLATVTAQAVTNGYRNLEFIFGECIKTSRTAKDQRDSVAFDDCRRIKDIVDWLKDHPPPRGPAIVGRLRVQAPAVGT